MTAIKPETPKKTNKGLIIAVAVGLGLCGLVALGLLGAGGAAVYFGQATAQAGATQAAQAAQAQATAEAQAAEATATAEAEAATATACRTMQAHVNTTGSFGRTL